MAYLGRVLNSSRICPGRYFAESAVWLVTANILAVFDILPPIDPVTGRIHVPELKWVGGLSS